MRFLPTLIIMLFLLGACAPGNTISNRSFGYTLTAPQGWSMHKENSIPGWTRGPSDPQPVTFLKDDDIYASICVAASKWPNKYDKRVLSDNRFQEMYLDILTVKLAKEAPFFVDKKWAYTEIGAYESQAVITDPNGAIPGPLHFVMRFIPYRCPDGHVCNAVLVSLCEKDAVTDTTMLFEHLTKIFTEGQEQR